MGGALGPNEASPQRPNSRLVHLRPRRAPYVRAPTPLSPRRASYVEIGAIDPGIAPDSIDIHIPSTRSSCVRTRTSYLLAAYLSLSPLALVLLLRNGRVSWGRECHRERSLLYYW